jgi:hypothetical protein
MKSSLQVGLPMIASVLLGTWGLTRIQQAKFDARDTKKQVASKREKMGIAAQPIDPQEIYFVICLY